MVRGIFIARLALAAFQDHRIGRQQPQRAGRVPEASA
jgi:hypothetical protein